MIRGMPLLTQVMWVSVPWPPAAWSARLASKIAWYYGVNGGCCAAPGGLVGSHWVRSPLGRVHRPDQSGYLVSSNAEAPAMVNARAAATAAPAIRYRCDMWGFSPDFSPDVSPEPRKRGYFCVCLK
jgi:hypothetical protein